jgi:hypothetical protein
MGYGIGSVMAILVTFFARSVGLDRDRAFYPTVLIVVASYYVLFAVMGGSAPVLVVEAIVMAGFAVLAVVGFKSSLWIVAAGLAGHGIFDIFHGHIVRNAAMPEWWPAFCMSYDVIAGGCLAWLLKRRNH